MAPQTETNDNLNYLLLVLKHAEFKPDYHAIATEAALTNANNAQKKFKKLVELGGFRLVNGAVVSADESGSVPVKTVKPRSKKTTAPVTKKRKQEEVEDDDGAEEDEANEEQEK